MDELIAFLNARLDEDEQGARDAALAVADHTYAPIDAEEMSAKTAAWTTARVLMHKRVTVEDPGWDPKVTDIVWASVGDHIARHDPARVLADVAAKRKLIEYITSPQHLCPKPQDDENYWWEGGERVHRPIPCGCLRALAAPYADHPDYREEWRSA